MANVKVIMVDASNCVSNITVPICFPYGANINGLTGNVTLVSNNYNIVSTDDILIVSNVSGCTITLPAATGSGKVYNIKSSNVGSVVIDANVSGGTIDGEIVQTIGEWDNATIVDADSSKWYIL